MVCVAVTGGLACGKSTFMQYIKSNYSFPIIDADVIVRELYNNDKELQQVFAGHFGAEVLHQAHGIDTKFLRERIFSVAKDRAFVEAQVHPLVRKKVTEFRDAHLDQYAIVIIPLVYETDSSQNYDAVVAIDLPMFLQVERAKLRGMPSLLIEQIIQQQASAINRRSIADDVLYNTRHRSFFYRQIDLLLVKHRQRFSL